MSLKRRLAERVLRRLAQAAPLRPAPVAPPLQSARPTSTWREPPAARVEDFAHLPQIASPADLPALDRCPGYVLGDAAAETSAGLLACAYCGVGDSGVPKGRSVGQRSPTQGCEKLKHSAGRVTPLFPIHTAPSLKGSWEGGRKTITYEDAVVRLAELILRHRGPGAQVLVYACGQADYFTLFALQEVFRLLGVRNLSGNAEHCLNSGAVHNEILTGQEGPFLTIEGALDGPDRMFLCNGWNGRITHTGAWTRLLAREELDAWLVDVMWTESAQELADRLGPERVLLIRPGGDAHLALGVAHELLAVHPEAIDRVFLDRYGDAETWEKFLAVARDPTMDAAAVATRLAPEPGLARRLERGIRAIAARLAEPTCIPVNIPSVGLSQTSGVVAHCLWGNALAAVGKYGLRPDGTPAGGVLRLPGQVNAETEVQGLNRRHFFGRVPVDEEGAREVARRMGLPVDAYDVALNDEPRPVLDYTDPESPYLRELVICLGTGFSSSMMERPRWVRKLLDDSTTLVVVDPIPDPFSLQHAELVIPTPPHAAAAKLYQNGEWRLTLSVPTRQAPPETRTDPTLIYDVMRRITHRLRKHPVLQDTQPDLKRLLRNGYLDERFGDGLPRIDGEVCRETLWRRVLDYMADGPYRDGALYCRPEHDDGTEVAWSELVREGSVRYGGVGTTRFVLDPDDPDHHPFRDIYRRPRRFRFFVPRPVELELAEGPILNSGRSTLTDDPQRIRFAVRTFNSGKHTPADGMPDFNPLLISPSLAAKRGLSTGDVARITNRLTGWSIDYEVEVTDRLPGDLAYVSIHKCRAELEDGQYLNRVTSHRERCRYSGQGAFKRTKVEIEKVADLTQIKSPPDTGRSDAPEAASRVEVGPKHADPARHPD